MAIFGKPPIDPALIAAEIITTVRRQVNDDCPSWTQMVKDVLRRRADRKRHEVYPDKMKGRREWLLDVVWYDGNDGTVHLAAESEWGSENDVLDDFEKLLCIKSPLKVMAYYKHKEPFVGRFEEYMQAFNHHVKGEHYLLVEFAPGPTDRAYLYKVPKDGRLTNVKFRELDLGKAKAA